MIWITNLDDHQRFTAFVSTLVPDHAYFIILPRVQDFLGGDLFQYYFRPSTHKFKEFSFYDGSSLKNAGHDINIPNTFYTWSVSWLIILGGHVSAAFLWYKKHINKTFQLNFK